MTIEEFDETLGHLLTLVLPPSCDDNPPVIAERVIEVMEDHIAAVRDTIIPHHDHAA
jgi:hypothetical protein